MQSSFPCLVGLDLSKFQQLLHIALSLLPMPSELVLVPSLSRLGGGRPLGHTHPPAIIFLFRRRRRPTRKHELDERRPAGWRRNALSKQGAWSAWSRITHHHSRIAKRQKVKLHDSVMCNFPIRETNPDFRPTNRMKKAVTLIMSFRDPLKHLCQVPAPLALPPVVHRKLDHCSLADIMPSR